MGSIAGLDDIQATSQYQPPETLASAGNQPSTAPTTSAPSGQPTAAQPQPTANQPPPPVEPEQRESLQHLCVHTSMCVNSTVILVPYCIGLTHAQFCWPCIVSSRWWVNLSKKLSQWKFLL